MKTTFETEGNETVTSCHSLKMLSPDNKVGLTEMTDI